MGATDLITMFRTASPEALEAIAEELKLRRTSHVIVLFSMGSQFDHLIKLAIEKLGIFCLIADPATVTAADVEKLAPAGIVISGGPASVHSEPPPFDENIFKLSIPTFGICLGGQMLAHAYGVPVKSGEKREFSLEKLHVLAPTELIDAEMDGSLVQQSHGDIIVADAHTSAITITASTSNSPIAAFVVHDAGAPKHGVQFHPEVSHSEAGARMIENFCVRCCGINDRFPAHDVADQKIAALKKAIGDGDVVLGLSGGSDSSVVAHLCKRAMEGSGGTLYGIYIKGIDRPDDEAHVHEFFGYQPWIRVEIVDATEEFLAVLAGKTSMKEKRIAMRGVYKSVFEKKVAELRASGRKNIFIAQGTLYTDLVESGHGHQTGARRAQIKLHHNTGLDFSVPEIAPLDDCVKDNARDIGRSIGVPETLLVRHPFPGPGQVVRIEGEVTKEKLAIVRHADGIFIEELRKADLYEGVWQAGAVVTNSRCTCTKGDDAAEGWVIALWAVWSTNGFTATAARLPWDFIDHVSNRITNEIKEAGAVVYRTSNKPPATIEWG